MESLSTYYGDWGDENPSDMTEQEAYKQHIANMISEKIKYEEKEGAAYRNAENEMLKGNGEWSDVMFYQIHGSAVMHQYARNVLESLLKNL